MANPVIDYFKPENMTGKKLSDLRDNPDFLLDATRFLTSQRKGYTQEEVDEMDTDSLISEVLNHFRVQSTNEVTMSKDYYFVSDEKTPEEAKQSYGRLLFAFENADSEGIFDNYGQAIRDYGEGVATAPTTYASIAAGAFTAGTGGAAVQASRAAAQTALRKVANKYVGRAILSGAIDGGIGAAQAFGTERIKQKSGEELGEEYDINYGNVALGGAIGGAMGAAGYYLPARAQNKAAQRFNDEVIAPGAEAYAKRYAEADAAAEEAVKTVTSSETGKRRAAAISDTLLRSIDPKLVREGQQVKANIFSEDLPQELLAGLSPKTMKRLGAAALEIAEKFDVKMEEGERITEFLAKALTEDRAATIATVGEITDKFGLSLKQLSAAYAAEVSDAARLLASQRNLKGIQDLKTTVDNLVTAGMSDVTAEDTTAIIRAEQQLAGGEGLAGKFWRKFKDIEDARRMFMTSQPATTMRNNIFSGAMTVIDGLDQLNLGLVRYLKGDEKAAGATWKGSLDILRYMSKDAYVADAFNKVLHRNMPEKMQRVFFEAAAAESALVKDSRWAKAGVAVNALNSMSDFVVKRAVIAGTIDRELRQLGDEALGTSVYDMLRKGTEDMLPQDILDKALDDSLAFTFQRRFRQGADVSTEQALASKAINTIHKYGLTTLVPFPRFIASQAKFISDYTPLTLLRRTATGRSISDEEVAKSITGAVIAGGMYGVQANNVANDLEWYETEDNGQVLDAQSALGPLSATAFIMHQVARVAEGYETKSTTELMNEFNKIVVGTEFRPGTGLYAAVEKGIENDSWEPIIQQVGDYFSTFTYPAAVAKDVYGQFDPRSSVIPETRDYTFVNMLELPFGIDVPMSLYSRMAKQLPDVSLPTLSETLKDVTGIDIPAPKLKGWVDYFNGQSRTYFQTKYNKGYDLGDESYEAVRFDIFSDGPARLYNPLQKQVTGMVGRPPKNELQREMTKLALDPFKIYSPYREKNVVLEILTQQILQGDLASEAKQFITGDKPLRTKEGMYDYQSLPSDQRKAVLKKWIQGRVTDAREQAREWLLGASQREETAGDFMLYVKGEYKAMTPDERTYGDMFWNQERDALGYSDMSFDEALRFVRDSDMVDEEEVPYKQNVLIQQYLLGSKRYKKAAAQ